MFHSVQQRRYPAAIIVACMAAVFVFLLAACAGSDEASAEMPSYIPEHLPYVSMDERWIDETALGAHDDAQAGERNGKDATTYIWRAQNGTDDEVFEAVCVGGVVRATEKESRDRNYWQSGGELPDRTATGEAVSKDVPEGAPPAAFEFGQGSASSCPSLSPQDFDSAQGYADAVASQGGSWDDAYARWEDECGDDE